jgi:hypothetical protein
MWLLRQINLMEYKFCIILNITCTCNAYVFGNIMISIESVLIRVQNQRPASIFFSSITLFYLACSLNSSCRISFMLLCGSCILGSHAPISATWLYSVINSWKDIPLLSQNIAAWLRIQGVISRWKSRLEGSKKERISDMIVCYTDEANPRVGGVYIG